MAAAKKIKPLVLDVAAVVEDFYEDCSLIGLHMEGDVFQNVWRLNQIFSLNLQRNTYFSETTEFKFDLYQYYDRINSLSHAVYSNRKFGHTLAPQYRGLELLWLINGNDNAYYFIENIRKVARVGTHILSMKEIDLDTFEHKGALLF
jgi:hypothetical protein